MKKLCLLLLAFSFAQELEVDGNLTVTEDVTASSFVGDGSGLTNLPSLGDMKPERIYLLNLDANETSSELIVPNDKFWIIKASTYTSARIIYDGLTIAYLSSIGAYGTSSEPIAILNNQEINIYNSNGWARCIINIFEYPISGSGTDQGMDYIEP